MLLVLNRRTYIIVLGHTNTARYKTLLRFSPLTQWLLLFFEWIWSFQLQHKFHQFLNYFYSIYINFYTQNVKDYFPCVMVTVANLFILWAWRSSLQWGLEFVFSGLRHLWRNSQRPSKKFPQECRIITSLLPSYFDHFSHYSFFTTVA